MADKVLVRLIQPVNIRMNKGEEYSKYRPGLVEMPREHARVAGLLHRVVSQEEVKAAAKGKTFKDNFDDNLWAILEEQGWTTAAALHKASHDELLATGMGPANFERVQLVLRGNG